MERRSLKQAMILFQERCASSSSSEEQSEEEAKNKGQKSQNTTTRRKDSADRANAIVSKQGAKNTQASEHDKPFRGVKNSCLF